MNKSGIFRRDLSEKTALFVNTIPIVDNMLTSIQKSVILGVGFKGAALFCCAVNGGLDIYFVEKNASKNMDIQCLLGCVSVN